VRCDREKRGCSYCTERRWECDYGPGRDRIPYRPPAIACGSCHDRKTKCVISEESKPACTKCSDLPKSCSYHPDYKPGNERDRIPYRPPATACGSCRIKKTKCEISNMSEPACTKCSASRTECSFQKAYGSGSEYNQDTDGLPEAEEEVRSRPTSPAGSISRPEQSMEAEGSGTSRVQPPVTEVLESQLPLITPESDRLDQNRTEPPVSGIRKKGDAIHHHRDNGNVLHPFQWDLR
jgi:hypothetical protein